jgi:hypothetical protein
MDVPTWEKLGWLGQILGEDFTEIDFQISMEFGIWQDFENFYKEI